MKRRLLTILLSISILGGLCGCNKEQTKVEKVPAIATIIDTKYRAPFMTPNYNPATKTWTYIHHPEDFDTYLKCNNAIYNLDTKEAFLACDMKDGQEIDVNYVMTYHKDGTIETYVELVEVE